MKVYRNYKEIKRRESIGRRFSLTGLGVLFLGLLISFVPTWLPPTEPIQPGISIRICPSTQSMPMRSIDRSLGS